VAEYWGQHYDFILAGVYDIAIEHPGFAKTVNRGVVVQSNQVVRTDVVLRVGATTDVVTVEATSPPISTDDATLSETLNTRSISDLPLNGRDALKLAATTSNVIVGPKSDFTGTPPGEDFIGAGTREITNSLTLDGITIMNNLITVTSVTPNLDAIQEVQIQNGTQCRDENGSQSQRHFCFSLTSCSTRFRQGLERILRAAYRPLQNPCPRVTAHREAIPREQNGAIRATGMQIAAGACIVEAFP